MSLNASDATNAYSVFGLRVHARSIHAGDVLVDPLSEMFACAPQLDEPGHADVNIELRWGHPAPVRSAVLGGPLCFFVGPFNAYRLDNASNDTRSSGSAGFVLVAPGATIHVSPHESSIRAVATSDMLRNSAREIELALLIAVALTLRTHDRFHLHAGAALTPEGKSVLILGGSGAGKTTTTLALAAAGARPLGDDTLFAWRADSGVRLASFRRHFHVGAHARCLFPDLAAFVGEPVEFGSDKRVLDASRAFAGRLVLDVPAPSVILCPTVRPAEATRIEPAEAVRGVVALLESSQLMTVQGAGRTAQQCRVIEELAHDARVYAVTLGIGALDFRGAGVL